MTNAPTPRDIMIQAVRDFPNHTNWRHLKTGGAYRFIGIALIEKTLEPAVLYCGKDNLMWSRPQAEFLERFEPVVT
jgi:hypothetical protein